MRNRALVQYDEFPLSIDNLNSLPNDHVAAISTLEFAISEINALRRIFLSQSHDYIGDKVIDEASSIQRLVILRTWSSKLFEVKEFLSSLCGKKPLSDDPKLKELAAKALVDMDSLELTEGLEVARDVRNEASNHYSFDAAKKNASHIHKGALLSMFIHRHTGNDFFPMGEAVMFHGRLHRRWKNTPSLDERREKFEKWIAWCFAITDSLIKTHATFADELVFRALGRNSLRQKNFWVPETLVGHPLSKMTPVFFREE